MEDNSYFTYIDLGGKIFRVEVVDPEHAAEHLSESDLEMDYRAREAVKAAIHKAKVLKKPIARWDAEKEMAYLEYPDGERRYSE